jgi:hypothetical protein
MNQTVAAIFSSARRLEERPSEEPVPFLDVSALRQAQRDLGGVLSRSDLSPQERLLAYFAMHFIDDVFYNLTGDIPADENMAAVQVQFFKGVADSLGRLADSLEHGAHDRCISICDEMIRDLLQTIDKFE